MCFSHHIHTPKSNIIEAPLLTLLEVTLQVLDWLHSFSKAPQHWLNDSEAHGIRQNYNPHMELPIVGSEQSSGGGIESGAFIEYEGMSGGCQLGVLGHDIPPSLTWSIPDQLLYCR